MPSVFLVFITLFALSSAYNLNPPSNYTWPLNSKHLCFVGYFDLVLNVDYVQTSGAKATARIPLNNDTYESYRVSCTQPSNVHELAISMLTGFTEVLMHFTVNDKNTTSLTTVYGYVTLNDKQNYFKDYAKALEGVHHFSSNVSLFETERGMSYRCNTKTTIQGFSTNGNVNVTSLELENLRVQPFVDDSKDFEGYGDEKVCSADIDKNSNLIPIIVGASLAALVVIVLVAYLIGRRRSRNGYQTV